MFAPKCPIGNKSALIQLMNWRRSENRTLSEPMITMIFGAYVRY